MPAAPSSRVPRSRCAATTLAAERRATTDATRRVSPDGAAGRDLHDHRHGRRASPPSAATLEVTLNRVVTFDVTLQVGGVQETIAVSTPALDPSTSATGATITPREITELPVNGRNYLDLLQLVPGVAINRQVDPDNDRANPVLGERSGNNNFLIDGQSNKDTVNGGPAQQFNQETIAEFQVLTSGYKAEFGQASGAIVNVITKSGEQSVQRRRLAVLSGTMRSIRRTRWTRRERSRCRCAATTRAWRSAVRWSRTRCSSSVRRSTSARSASWISSIRTPATRSSTSCCASRKRRTTSRRELSETRAFFKFDERIGQHQLSQQVNYTDSGNESFLPLSSANSLPSARNDTDTTRHAARFRRHGVARQSRQPLCRHAPRRVPRREQRDASVADGFHRVNALQSL